MNYGLYLSASGVLTNLYRQDVYANNLANVQTPGFKPDFPNVQPRLPEAVEDNVRFDLRQPLLDRIGGGVLAGRQMINFGVGPVVPTGNQTDVALDQPGHFFAVARTDPQSGERSIHLTRDGRFMRNAQGALVTANGGHEVLDPNDAPIQLSDAPIQIDESGGIHQDGELVGRLQVSSLPDPQALRKVGENLFAMQEGVLRRQAVEAPRVRPGFVEGSQSDPIVELTKLIEATRAVAMNSRMIQYHDGLMDRAVNVLGRVLA